jgi:hypothetical protein
MMKQMCGKRLVEGDEGDPLNIPMIPCTITDKYLINALNPSETKKIKLTMDQCKLAQSYTSFGKNETIKKYNACTQGIDKLRNHSLGTTELRKLQSKYCETAGLKL